MKTGPGRPAQFDVDVALEAAMQQFWSKGYDATSLHDLLSAMRLSKSSLYQAFGDKHQLFCKCLSRYVQQCAGSLRLELARAPGGLAFVEAFLRKAAGGAEGAERRHTARRGCFVTNTASELAPHDPVVAAAVQHGLAEFRAVLLDAVLRAQTDGEVAGDADPGLLASLLLVSASGLRTQAKAGLPARTLHAVVSAIVDGLRRNARLRPS